MTKFIHFGCWNKMNDGCLHDVMNLLNTYIDDTIDVNRPNFISIVGDNYYPTKLISKKDGKNNKIKIIKLDELTSGFDLLPKIIPIYMILGNHDLETTIEGESVPLYINDKDNTYTEVSGACTILQQEKIVTKGTNIELLLFKAVLLENETLLLMVDTSMYSQDVSEFIPCYNIFLDTTEDNPFNLERLITYQNELIINALEYNKDKFKHLIISGHHPITGLKNKNGNINQLNDIPKFLNVLKESIYARLGNSVSYVYLCADLHLFQKGQIEIEIEIDDVKNIMSIDQYIVGTGGAELDDMFTFNYTTPIQAGITYTMIENIKECGFLECITTETGPTFRFITIPKVGGNRRRRRTKSRKSRKRSICLKSRRNKLKKRKTKKPRRKYKLI